MNIKSRVQKLEQRNAKQAILAPKILCSDTGKGLTEASARARYVAGDVSVELGRDGNESLTGFKDRLRSAGVRRVSEVHPNAIFVYAGVMGAEHQHCR